MLDQEILRELERFIEENLSIKLEASLHLNKEHYDVFEETETIELDNFIKDKRKPSLNHVLFSLIDKKEANDVDIYKRAGLDRRHFSKIRSNINYIPKKNTILALALALELNIEETDELLRSAGYSLTDNDTNDLIIQFCLEKKIYDLYQVNQFLDYFKLKPLT